MRFYPNGVLELWQRQSQKEICGSKSLEWRDMESGLSERKNGREGEGETQDICPCNMSRRVFLSLRIFYMAWGR